MAHIKISNKWPSLHSISNFHNGKKRGFPGGSVVKNMLAKQETEVQSPGVKDILEKEMATHSSILAWVPLVVKNPPDIKGAGSVPVLARSPWRRAWKPTPIFLTGESHGRRSLAGYSPQGHRVGHDWSNLARICYVCVLKLCPTLCDLMDCNPPASSVHGVFQARILESVVISYSRESFQPRDPTHVSCISCIGRQIL